MFVKGVGSGVNTGEEENDREGYDKEGKGRE